MNSLFRFGRLIFETSVIGEIYEEQEDIVLRIFANKTNQVIDVEKTYNHWVQTSDKDYLTMVNLYNSKDYHWALFIGHIVIEKLLKATVVKKSSKHAPFTHDLTKLADESGHFFSEEYLDWLDTISTFNINARYDSYKEAFYKKCTHEFTTEWIEKIKTLRIWIKMKLSE